LYFVRNMAHAHSFSRALAPALQPERVRAAFYDRSNGKKQLMLRHTHVDFESHASMTPFC
jgi:hypothetical protein